MKFAVRPLAVPLLAGLLCLAGPAAAQKKVFRCELNGKISYADAPCKDATEVAADDARTEAQRKAARDALAREDKLTQQMARERKAAEAAAAKQGAAHIPHSAADEAAKAQPTAKKKKKPEKKAVAAKPAAQP
jgi:hypothetical protein